MKTSLFLLRLFIIMFKVEKIYSQLLPVIVPTISKNKYSQNDSSQKGYVWLPADYNKDLAKIYPVILSCHNSGLQGANPSMLLNDGALIYLLNQGMKLDSIINPSDGQPYSFIVLELQNTQAQSTDPTEIPAIYRWL